MFILNQMDVLLFFLLILVCEVFVIHKQWLTYHFFLLLLLLFVMLVCVTISQQLKITQWNISD